LEAGESELTFYYVLAFPWASIVTLLLMLSYTLGIPDDGSLDVLWIAVSGVLQGVSIALLIFLLRTVLRRRPNAS
jgi:hypothetical protein